MLRPSRYLLVLAALATPTFAAGQSAEPEAVGMGLPADIATPTVADHELFVGRFALGYLGTRSLLIGRDVAGEVAAVDAPVIGARYWLTSVVGIDAGVGLRLEGQESDQTGPAGDLRRDEGGDNALLLHLGVPLALASRGHFTFEVVPELNLGFAGQDLDAEGELPGLENSGFHFDLGVRGGAEIHFGFIGIPELALQGSVGLRYAIDRTSSETTSLPKQTYERRQSGLSTTLAGDPWDIFQGSIAALYYF